MNPEGVEFQGVIERWAAIRIEGLKEHEAPGESILRHREGVFLGSRRVGSVENRCCGPGRVGFNAAESTLRPQEVRLPWRIDFNAAKWGDFKAQGRAIKFWGIYVNAPGRSILRLRKIVFKHREGRF